MRLGHLAGIYLWNIRPCPAPAQHRGAVPGRWGEPACTHMLLSFKKPSTQPLPASPYSDCWITGRQTMDEQRTGRSGRPRDEKGKACAAILLERRYAGEGLAPGRGSRRRSGGGGSARPAAGGSPPTNGCSLRDLVVVKSNGRREDFDRDTAGALGAHRAAEKRPTSPERIDQMVSGIVRRLESMGETDMRRSKQIGRDP